MKTIRARKKTVGLRELKNRLSEYVRYVRKGETIVITDRGQAVAELTPPTPATSDRTIPPGLLDLARRGLVTLAKHRGPSIYRPSPGLLKAEEVSELLDWVRGER